METLKVADLQDAPIVRRLPPPTLRGRKVTAMAFHQHVDIRFQ